MYETLLPRVISFCSQTVLKLGYEKQWLAYFNKAYHTFKNPIIFSRLLLFIGLLLLIGKKYVYPLLRKSSCPYSSTSKGHKAFVW